MNSHYSPTTLDERSEIRKIIIKDTKQRKTLCLPNFLFLNIQANKEKH